MWMIAVTQGAIAGRVTETFAVTLCGAPATQFGPEGRWKLAGGISHRIKFPTDSAPDGAEEGDSPKILLIVRNPVPLQEFEVLLLECLVAMMFFLAINVHTNLRVL